MSSCFTYILTYLLTAPLVTQVFFELETKWNVTVLEWPGLSLEWPGLCEAFPVFFLTTQHLSPLLVLAFTVERYVAVCHPFHGERVSSTRRAVYTTLVLTTLTASQQLQSDRRDHRQIHHCPSSRRHNSCSPWTTGITVRPTTARPPSSITAGVLGPPGSPSDPPLPSYQRHNSWSPWTTAITVRPTTQRHNSCSPWTTAITVRPTAARPPSVTTAAVLVPP